jgi:hypothetical protein
MLDSWSYDKVKRTDRLGGRWHFVRRYFDAAPGEDEPREIYFRKDDKTEFGVIRFESVKEIPYRDYAAIVTKIMNNAPFRKALLDDETEAVWKKNWR